MSIMVGTGKGASYGVLIKDGEALERLEKITTLVVDKTGTLTVGKPAGVIAVKDPIKQTSKAAIQYFHAKNIEVVMLTGDSRTTAEVVTRELGVDRVEAEVLPDQKNEVIRKLLVFVGILSTVSENALEIAAVEYESYHPSLAPMGLLLFWFFADSTGCGFSQRFNMINKIGLQTINNDQGLWN